MLPLRRGGLEAAIFDLDGVVTFTAHIHAAAWTELFDSFLHFREEHYGEPFSAFTRADYLTFVDGRPRDEGIRAFLHSRGVHLPQNGPARPADFASVAALGEKKNSIFRARLQEHGVQVDHAAVDFIRELRSADVPFAVASSSRNLPLILRAACLEDLFPVRIDGGMAQRLQLRGKPEPDIFLHALRRLGQIAPAWAMVVEDALAGVEAGRRGGFGFVLGVDRHDQGEALRAHGADRVIRNFREISLAEVEAWFRNRS